MISKVKHRTIILTIFFVTIFVAIVLFLYPFSYSAKVILGGKTFNVEVVDTKEFLEKGLSRRKSLSESNGMLFDFQKSDNYGFWMKDMSFSIDIVWFDSDLKIVHMEKSISPKTYPKIFYPNSPSAYVLEISAGQSDSLGLKIGDSAKLIKKYF